MTKSIVALLAVAALTSALAMSSQARAEIKYPWCGISGTGGGGTNCGFTSFDQCRAAMSGTNGSCFENADYQAPKQPAKKSAKPR